MQYVKECLQLLYWIYFKPYTLKQHVQAICPEITDPYQDNFLRRSVEIRKNSLLKRYDDQIWWLTVITPVTGIFIFLALAVFLRNEPLTTVLRRFNLAILPFYWLIIQLFFRATRRKLNRKLSILLMLIAVFVIIALIKITGSIAPFLTDVLVLLTLVLAGGLAVGLTSGTAGGISFDVSFGPIFILLGVLVTDKIANEELLITTCGIIGMLLGSVVSRWDGTSKPAIAIALKLFTGLILFGISIVKITEIAGVFFFTSYILGVFRCYFWILELLWTFFIRFIPFYPAYRLSLLPPKFDQFIILPLPFLPIFISEAYQENQAAARQTIDYLITSTNQQKTAAKAISKIAAEECSLCQSTGEIAAIKEQLNWISDTQQSTSLKACFEISQDVTAAQEASSLYRKGEQMGRVVQKIERKRNALAAASAQEATSFGAVLDSWQRILETACRILREQAKHSNEIPQVYLAGSALAPDKAGPLFKGRNDLFRQIETLTLSAQHPTLVMYGGRRTGKTSTLNYLPKWMPSDILPLLVDGQSLAATSTLSGFAEEFADLITRSARKVHSLHLPALDSVKQSDDPFVCLRRWLDAVEQNIPDKTMLICLDEFERLDEIVNNTNSRAPLNFLRHLIQHRERWTLLFAGAHMPEELPSYWSDYLINSQTLRVSYLNKEDTLALIQEPVKDFPDIYPAEVAQALAKLSGGQPYFTQLLCHELVEQLNRKKAKRVEMEDLETVLPTVFERGYQVFREFWDTLTTEQQELLTAVALGIRGRPDEELVDRLAKAAPMLIRREIIEEEAGSSGYSFRVPLLQRWVLARGASS